MTTDQYSELVDFLGGKFGRIDEQFARIDEQFARIDQKFARVDERFEQIDRRFEQIDRRFERIDEQFAETRRHAVVLFEQSQANLQVVAEGLGLRLERLEKERR